MADDPHIAYCNLGPWPGYFAFTTSTKAFRKEMRRLKIGSVEPFGPNADASTHYLKKPSDKSLLAVIIMPKPSKDHCFAQYAALVSHEATHVVQELWRNLNEREPGDEAEAYLVQHIVQFCLLEAYKSAKVRALAP